MAAEVKHHELYGPLCAIVGPKYVADSDFANYAYSADLDLYSSKMPGIIVRPGTTEEVADIVKLANRTHTPIVPRAGGASLLGWKTGEAGRNIIVDVTRMDKVLDIDVGNMLLTVEAGTLCSKIETIVEEKTGGEITAHTVWMPAYSATIGGVVSGVTGGGLPSPEFVAQGLARDNIIGLKIVMPTGEVLQTGLGPGVNVCAKKTFSQWVPTGDFTPMFLGDGGSYGIKTEVTLKLHRVPKVNRSGSALFDSFEDAWNAEYALTRIEPLPYGNLWGVAPPMLKLQLGIEMKEHCLIYSVRGNTEEEVDLKEKAIREAFAKNGGKPGTAATDAMAKGLMESPVGIRELGATYAVGLLGATDQVFPLHGFMDLYRESRKFLDEWEPRCQELNIPGLDHFEPCGPNIMYYAVDKVYHGDNPESKEVAREITDQTAEWAWRAGGAVLYFGDMSAEIAGKFFSPAYYSFMKTLKTALDPNNIMNPGLWGI